MQLRLDKMSAAVVILYNEQKNTAYQYQVQLLLH